jgi:hypothetical protein
MKAGDHPPKKKTIRLGYTAMYDGAFDAYLSVWSPVSQRVFAERDLNEIRISFALQLIEDVGPSEDIDEKGRADDNDIGKRTLIKTRMAQGYR